MQISYLDKVKNTYQPIPSSKNRRNFKFQFQRVKIQHSTPICIKHSTPTQNKFASDDSIELALQSTMNIKDTSSIFNSETDEMGSSGNTMYLIPKETQVGQKDGSSYSKSSKLLTEVLGDS